jgi:hypothetical protein
VVNTTIMMPVKSQSAKFYAPEVLPNGLQTCYGGSNHERLLSESSGSNMLAFRMYVISCRSKFPKEYFDYNLNKGSAVLNVANTLDSLQVVNFQTLLYIFCFFQKA